MSRPFGSPACNNPAYSSVCTGGGLEEAVLAAIAGRGCDDAGTVAALGVT
jgi:hypothetical protein